MKVIQYLEQLLPKWKISEKPPDFLVFERDRCQYTLQANKKLSSRVVRMIAQEVIDHYGRHLLNYEDKELER